MTMTYPTVQRLLLISLLATCIAACGDGGSGDDSADAQATAQEPTETSPPAPSEASPIADGPGAEPAPESPVATIPVAEPAPPVAEAGRGSAMVNIEAVSATQSIIYVSTTGKDTWSGQLATANAAGTDGPLKTLTAAQTLARARLAAMASGSPRLAVRVLIQPGTYPLTVPLAMTAADSGTASAPMSYEAVNPGTVTISGGVTLIQRTAASGGSAPAVFDVPGAAGTNWNGGGQLFVNGRRATLARQPNAGQYYFIQKATALPTEAANAQGRAAFVPSPEALTWVNGLPSVDRSRAVVNIMHAWTASQHHFASSAPAGSIQVAPSANWGFLVSGVSQRYFIENVAQALDAPGEWFWDASGVRYIPAAGEAGATLTAVMPVLSKLITISGNMNNQTWAQYISIKGLTFAHTRYQTPSNGFFDSQAASYAGAAIEVDNAKNIQIDNCVVTGVAGYGVWLRRAVRDSTITNSTMNDLGAGGLQMSHQYVNSADPMQSGHNSATGNRIGNTGKIFPGAVGIWVGTGFDNTVANNLVYNTTYSGISVGWTWGYGTATSGNNKITDNLLANIGQGMLSDMGGIYTVGIAAGTTLSGNVIREVRGYPAYGAGAWGIYQDNGSSQTVVSNNIVVGTGNGTYQLGTGRRNTVQSNLLALGDRTELNLAVSDPANTPLTVTGNLMIPKVVQPFAGYTQSPDTLYSGNVVSTSRAAGTLNLSKCGAGCTTQAVVLNTTTDPRGVAIVGTDSATILRIAQTAAKAGPTNLANASSVVTVASQTPPVAVAPPIGFTIDIANAALGSQPVGFWYSKVGLNAPTTVAANASAPNGRCLQYTDSSSNANNYDPHTYAALNHASGTTTDSFSLLIDAKTNMAHQWRDVGVPAKVGPSLTITAAGVSVAGKVVAPVTVGGWMKFSVTSRLANPTGTWSLQVTNPQGQVTTVNNLAYGHSGWSSLNWLGFISNATVASSFCLHSLQVANTSP
jgi:Right handed beta helix region